MKATVTIMPRKEVLDPQGEAVLQTLKNLGLGTVTGVRVGKLIILDIEDISEDDLDAVCKNFLSNPVVEDYTIFLEE